MFEGSTPAAGEGQRGTTGLEAAIVLIAFVAAALVFAHTSISAGLLSSQREEGASPGPQRSRGTLELVGGVIALDAQEAIGIIDRITFTLSTAAGEEPIDFTAPTDSDADGLADPDSDNKVIINMITKEGQANNISWTKVAVGEDDGDELLEEGEMFQITLGGGDAGLRDEGLSASQTFTLQVVPPGRAALIVKRTLPAVMDDVMNLN